MAAEISYRVRLRGTEGITNRGLDQALRRIMATFPTNWHQRFLARHFTRQAYAIYHYTRRDGDVGGGTPLKGSYTARKLRTFGHTLPLVYTGRGRAEALANRIVKVTKTSAAGYVARCRLPRIFNFRYRHINPAQELATVTRNENRALDQLANQQVEREIAKAANPYTLV